MMKWIKGEFPKYPGWYAISFVGEKCRRAAWFNGDCWEYKYPVAAYVGVFRDENTAKNWGDCNPVNIVGDKKMENV